MKTYQKYLIIIHGAGPKHYRSLKDGSGDWQTKLATDLSSEFKIITPQMPSPKNPTYEEWKELLDKNLSKLHGEVTFVGHSLGGSFLVKYLAEEKIAQKISGLFLVAAPFNTIKGFEAPSDFSVFQNLQNAFLYHSMDDVEVPYAHALIYRERMKAMLRTFSDRGHYFKKAEFPEIIQDLRETQISKFPDYRL